ncbi:MAG: uracil-DNA glycosylase [Elusimicrobiota bacterium]
MMSRQEFSELINLTKLYLNQEAEAGLKEVLIEGNLKKKVDSSLEGLRAEMEGCQICPLGKARLKVVFGVGDPQAQLMFVGEGPGYDEDHRGEPFIGRAGQLLTKIIEAIGFKRSDVYIANIVKCHPMIDPTQPESRGNDRKPSLDEINSCRPFLERQIKIIKPKIIVALGNVAAQTLLGLTEGIGALRGRFYDYQGIKLMPTYHPAALLRNPNFKKDVWEDMKMVRDELAK